MKNRKTCQHSLSIMAASSSSLPHDAGVVFPKKRGPVSLHEQSGACATIIQRELLMDEREMDPAAKRRRRCGGPAGDRGESGEDFLFLDESDVKSIEKDISYQAYDLSNLKTDVTTARILTRGTHSDAPSGVSKISDEEAAAWSALSLVKQTLNKEKRKIDRFQLSLPKNELHERYHSLCLHPTRCDIDLTLVLRHFDKFHPEAYEKTAKGDQARALKKRMLMDLFYAQLTDAIYLMNFKRELHREFGLKRFSNAALKMTEILCKEDLCGGGRRGGGAMVGVGRPACFVKGGLFTKSVRTLQKMSCPIFSAYVYSLTCSQHSYQQFLHCRDNCPS